MCKQKKLNFMGFFFNKFDKQSNSIYFMVIFLIFNLKIYISDWHKYNLLFIVLYLFIAQ